MTENQAGLIYLLASALGGIPPEPAVLRRMNIPEIAREAARHSVSAMCCAALASAGVYDSHGGSDGLHSASDKSRDAASDGIVASDEATAHALAQLRERREKSVRKIMLLDCEREAILAELDRAKIWYTTLKGIGIKQLYPAVGMREMSDNDILFDPKGRAQVRDIMIGRGYTVRSYGTYHHDTYTRAPIYNYEMHIDLIAPDCIELFQNYFSTISERLIWDDTSPDRSCYARRMTPADEYAYTLAHIRKHLLSHGTGIRSLCDIYVIARAKGGEPDAETAELLRRIGLDGLEALLRRAAYALFSEPVQPDMLSQRLDEDLMQIVDLCLSCGTYGNISYSIINDIMAHSSGDRLTLLGRLGYLRRRAFPPASWFRRHYDFLDRRPYLIPFFALRRLTYKAFGARRRLRREVRALREVKDREGGNRLP